MQRETKVGRRHALRVLGAGALSLGGLGALGVSTGCGGGEEGGGGGGGGGESMAGPSCNSPVPAEAQQLRSSLQYQAQSSVPDKRCDNCAQYKPGEFGDCGGCNLFAGPVQPGGYCLSWAAKEEGGMAATMG